MTEILNDVDMREYTSFRAGGKADRMMIPGSESELAEVLAELSKSGEEHIVIGNGSNILFRDGGYRGTVIKLGPAFEEIQVEGSRIIAGAGALMSKIAGVAAEAELSGFENLSGIPGSIGGAVFMNAGAYGTEIKDLVQCVKVVKADGSGTELMLPCDLELGYRYSRLQETGDIATEIVLSLTKGDRDAIAERTKEVTRKRVSKQPLRFPSAGSFFKRPEGDFAGRLIEDAGLKGLAVGGAQVSELHAGFIINKGGATATDILDLMELVQNTVFDKFGVKLEPEVRIMGE